MSNELTFIIDFTEILRFINNYFIFWYPIMAFLQFLLWFKWIWSCDTSESSEKAFGISVMSFVLCIIPLSFFIAKIGLPIAKLSYKALIWWAKW